MAKRLWPIGVMPSPDRQRRDVQGCWMVGGPGVTFASHEGALGAASPDPERSDAVLALENVGVRFGGISALSGVDLTVADGAVWGLIGPNGAGKTTLFDVI